MPSLVASLRVGRSHERWSRFRTPRLGLQHKGLMIEWRVGRPDTPLPPPGSGSANEKVHWIFFEHCLHWDPRH